MTRRRFIADEVSGDRAALVGEHADHLVRVLRARVGQEFDIATGETVRRGQIDVVSDGRVEFDLGEEVLPSETPPRSPSFSPSSSSTAWSGRLKSVPSWASRGLCRLSRGARIRIWPRPRQNAQSVGSALPGKRRNSRDATLRRRSPRRLKLAEAVEFFICLAHCAGGIGRANFAARYFEAEECNRRRCDGSWSRRRLDRERIAIVSEIRMDFGLARQHHPPRRDGRDRRHGTRGFCVASPLNFLAVFRSRPASCALLIMVLF